MFRFVLIVATLACALQCTTADAKGRSGKWFRGTKIGSMRSHSTGHPNHFQPTGRYRSYYPSSSFGFRIGVGSYPNFGPSYGYSRFGYIDPYRFDGYGYDPYRYGSFQAPDLLNDPYFIERHRNDSRFPGRRRSR